MINEKYYYLKLSANVKANVTRNAFFFKYYMLLIPRCASKYVSRNLHCIRRINSSML